MKQYSPAAERNCLPIFTVLNPLMPVTAQVLEVASGTGQHATFVAQKRLDLIWQPTDCDEEALASILAYQQECASPAMQKPIRWSVIEDRPTPLTGPFDVIVNINMIHISPWEACLRLMQQAEQLLLDEGVLFLYGPFLIKGRETAPSNLEFDRSLQERNPQWGLRDLDEVIAVAARHGLHFQEFIDMPANNLAVIFHRKTSKIS